MRKTALLIFHTCWRHIVRWQFVFTTFGLPLLIMFIPFALVTVGGLLAAAFWPERDLRPVGVVIEAPELTESEQEGLLFFAAESAAAAALHSGQIQAYYLVPADYWQTGNVYATFDETPDTLAEFGVRQWLMDQARGRVPPHILTQYETPITFAHEELNIPVPEEVEEPAPARPDIATATQGLFGIFAAIYLIRFGSLFTTSIIMESIISEADNRTIEIILTIFSPTQFVVGKFVALVFVGLLQMGIWGSLLGLIVVAADRVASLGLVETVGKWSSIWPAIFLLLGMYLLDQILGAAAGLLRVSSGIGYQILGFLGWITAFSLTYAMAFVPRDPNTTLAVVTSLIPFTSPIVMLVRLSTTTVPAWQITLSLAILWATIILCVYSLRFLLKFNLVAYAERFRWRTWLRQKFPRHRRSSTPSIVNSEP